jgi:type I restriction enzyme R subunit
VVDYIGLAADLKAALAHYSASDQERTGVDTRQAVEALMTALDVVRAMFTGIDYMAAVRGTPADRLRILPQAIERALTLEREAAAEEVDEEAARKASRKRFLDAAAAVVKAFKVAAGTPEADAVKEEVGFFVAVQIAVQKLYSGSGAGRSATSADFAIGQLVNQAVASTEVVDILGACGMDRPDISFLSEEFLAEVRQLRERILAVEALRKLLNGEIAARTRTNVVKHEEILGNAELLVIAAELVKVVRERADIDWWRRENVRSAMRTAVKRILRKHGFPPDLQDEAIRRVIQQAEALAGEFRRAA